MFPFYVLYKSRHFHFTKLSRLLINAWSYPKRMFRFHLDMAAIRCACIARPNWVSTTTTLEFIIDDIRPSIAI